MVVCVHGASQRRPRARVGQATSPPGRSMGLAQWLSSALILAMLLAATFVVVLVGVMVQPITSAEIQLMQVVQRPDHPALYPVLDTVRTLTGSEGAIVAWIVTGLVFLARRWWAPAVVVGLIPIGGVINEGISILLVERSRPHLDVLLRTSLNFEERSFPSGHVTGAVLLYGLIFVVARRIPSSPVRYVVQSLSVAVVLVTGYQRVWGGAHWPTDVLASYALGGFLLIGLVAVCRWLEPHLAGLSPVDAARQVLTLALAPVRERRAGVPRSPLSGPQPGYAGAAARYLATHRVDDETWSPSHRRIGPESETATD